ncbi:hypothetical protein [Amycolatopsis pithecellobii]|uniref:Uncharacterized protein n=1 Tax=Amycolatopsis pithecellobii TaxID=664692 RepID=A0A6N7YSH7_9PSEU|nr:hypothetical protein [Amycolatopsis pithecellobii]MTD55975.1 hypothetical protein [Amycolatopsis pithecellobii]
MKGKFARITAIAVAGSVLAMAGAGIASAEGKGTSSTEAVGQQVLQLRDQLTRAAYGADVAGTQRSLDRLDPVLGDLAAGQKYSIQADRQQQAADARSLASDSSRVLADPSQAPTARQLPVPVPDLPDLPPPLNIVTNLLKSLLTLVTTLLGGLLGGGVPSLPVPGLPVGGAPSLPTPGAPSLPVPGLPGV